MATISHFMCKEKQRVTARNIILGTYRAPVRNLAPNGVQVKIGGVHYNYFTKKVRIGYKVATR